jgi:hypothetical protein
VKPIRNIAFYRFAPGMKKASKRRREDALYTSMPVLKYLP